jgi:hypothetical protein
VAAVHKAGYETGIGLYKRMDVGAQVVRPVLVGAQEIDTA